MPYLLEKVALSWLIGFAWTAFLWVFLLFFTWEGSWFFFNFLEIGWFEEEFNSLNLFFTFLDNDKV
jgi:hypothetical protein